MWQSFWEAWAVSESEFFCLSSIQSTFFLIFRLLQVYNTLRILFCVFIILIGLMCLISLLWNSKDLKICINYLGYAGKFFRRSLVLVAFIFVFYLLLAGLFTLMIFQILAFWSHGEVKFYPS